MFLEAAKIVALIIALVYSLVSLVIYSSVLNVSNQLHYVLLFYENEMSCLVILTTILKLQYSVPCLA